MMTLLRHPIVTVMARLVVGTVFVVYGIDKIIAPKDFAHSILNYDIVPPAAVNVFALSMPWLEVVCGIMLIIGLRLRAAALLTSFMLVTFIMAISTAMFRGLEINCGCSANSEPVGVKKIVEDLVYLALCLHVLVYPHVQWTVESYVASRQFADSLNGAGK